MDINSIYKTKYGDLRILEYKSAKSVKVKFMNSGYETITRAEHIRSNLVKDPSYNLVCGVGIYREKNSMTSTRAYVVWSDMLRRCYDVKCKNYHRYGGRGVKCCDKWKDFSVFYKWFYDNYQTDYELDKDILKPSSLLYSPETCVFVPKRINALILLSDKNRGDLPIGVIFHKDRNKPYQARIKINGKYKSLGYFYSKENAFLSYKQYKEKRIRQVASEFYERSEISEEVYNALMQWTINIHD